MLQVGVHFLPLLVYVETEALAKQWLEVLRLAFARSPDGCAWFLDRLCARDCGCDVPADAPAALCAALCALSSVLYLFGCDGRGALEEVVLATRCIRPGHVPERVVVVRQLEAVRTAAASASASRSC